MAESPEEFHEFVCDLARRAGELQLSRLDDPGDITEKAPRDIVTEVDILCEELLVDAIEARYPDDSILSEERGGGISPAGRSWVLDPVDGTANFARANPIFCAIVSVIEDGEVTNAAVAAPRIGDLYHARKYGGAWRDSGGKRTRMTVSDTQTIEYSFVGADVSFSTKRNAKYRKPLEEIFERSWQTRALGSAGVRGAWLGAGYLDISIGTRNTPWDYAQTVLLAKEAGGEATDLDGTAWTPYSEGLVATNGRLHDEALEILNR